MSEVLTMEKELMEDLTPKGRALKKLSDVQTRLKAPKGQFNSFGKYSYRNCEDILESLKPLLRELNCIVLLSDEAVAVGNRVYIRATATFIDSDTGERIEVQAMAREDDSKKGMDSSQLTGSTSSYSRKYALNGLFAIDDNKDADTATISSEMVGILEVMAQQAGYNLEQTQKSVQKTFKKQLFQLDQSEYNNIMTKFYNIMQAKAEATEKANQANQPEQQPGQQVEQ